MKPLPLLICVLTTAVVASAADRGTRGSARDALAEAAARGLAETRLSLAFLGVRVEEAGSDVRDTLNLPAGIGLSVTFVQPGSPAAGAMLRRDDVLVRLDNQWLSSQAQLRTFVQACRPGEPVDLTVWRARREFVVRVRLASWSDPTAVREPLPGASAGLPGGAGDIRRNELGAMRRAGQLELRGENESSALPGATPGPALPDFENRDDLRYEIAPVGSHRRVVVRDPSGVEVYTGPIDTELDRGALPPGVLSAVEVIEMSSGLSDREMQLRLRARPRLRYPRIEADRPVNETLRAQTEDGGTVEVLVHGQHRELVVRDRDEKITYEGPINTDVERRLAPEAALKIADELVSGRAHEQRAQQNALLDETLI